MAVFHTSSGGKLKVVLEANQEWLRLMKPSERNLVLRQAGIRSVYDWRFTLLSLRFSNVVKQAPFAFTGKSKSPLVDSGEMRNNALNKSKPIVRAKSNANGTQQLSIAMATDYGHIVNSEVARVMRILTGTDNQFVADRFAFHVADARAGVYTPKRSNAKYKLRLTRQQKGRFGSTVSKAKSIRLRKAKSTP